MQNFTLSIVAPVMKTGIDECFAVSKIITESIMYFEAVNNRIFSFRIINV